MGITPTDLRNLANQVLGNDQVIGSELYLELEEVASNHDKFVEVSVSCLKLRNLLLQHIDMARALHEAADKLERVTAESQKDYDAMRDFQMKFMTADHKLRALQHENIKLGAVVEAAKKLGCRGSEEFSEPWLSFAKALEELEK